MLALCFFNCGGGDGLFISVQSSCSIGDIDYISQGLPFGKQKFWYSHGDCIPAKGPIFYGHETLTYLAFSEVADGAYASSYASTDKNQIIDGNRRTDFAKEVLVHLSVGLAQYYLELAAFTDRPEKQKDHFLRDNDDTFTDAYNNSINYLISLTESAVTYWYSDRNKANADLGYSLHLIQDSYAPEHGVRDEADSWKVTDIKCYIARDEGTETCLFHGGNEYGTDGRGGMTPNDNIYQQTQECEHPSTQAEAQSCLTALAAQSIVATKDYLEDFAGFIEDGVAVEDVGTEMEGFLDEHFATE